jgi:lipopolysaccharide/colanic/teichoic acid biosynthesis glycosyltransferase
VEVLAPAELAGTEAAARPVPSAAIRLFDVIVAALLLLLLLPLILLVVIAVRLESPGPVFFRCDRVGYGGRRLQMLKVRKMRHGAQGPALTAGADARFTRIGGLLATLKIDEIPQLFHVLRGQMSLVGPRPESAEFVDLHPEHYAQILSVRPGITGLSQVAFVDERRILDLADPLAFYTGRILPQKLTLDLMYVNRRSLSFNLRILFWTVAAVLLRRQVAVHRETGRMGIRRR